MLAASALLAGCSGSQQAEPSPDGVWSVVEARNAAWVANDRDAFMATVHPDYARWNRREPRLELYDDVSGFWEGVREHETSVSIDVIPERVQFLADGKAAIAHYTIEEVVEYVGEPFTQRGPKRFAPGERAAYRIRFSDVYELRGGKWLYVGGHRDGPSLPDRGEVPLPIAR